MSRNAVLLNDVMSYQVYPLVALAKALLLRSVSAHCRSIVEYGAPSRFVDVAVGRAVTYEGGCGLDWESGDLDCESGDILSIQEARLVIVDDAVLDKEAVPQRAVEILCAHGTIVAFKAPGWLMDEGRPGAPDGGPAVTLFKRCGATLSLDVGAGGGAVNDTTIEAVAAYCCVIKSFSARSTNTDGGLAHLRPDSRGLRNSTERDASPGGG